MPMKSKAQRRFLWATNPEVAKEFESKTPEGKKLPEHLAKGGKCQNMSHGGRCPDCGNELVQDNADAINRTQKTSGVEQNARSFRHHLTRKD